MPTAGPSCFLTGLHVGADVDVTERSGSDLAPKAELSTHSKLHGSFLHLKSFLRAGCSERAVCAVWGRFRGFGYRVSGKHGWGGGG